MAEAIIDALSLPSGGITVGGAGVAIGATSLPVNAGIASYTAGSFSAYIGDGVTPGNDEVVRVSAGANTTTWTTSAFTKAHAAGRLVTPIVSAASFAQLKADTLAAAPTGTKGESVLGVSFDLSTTGVWENTGLFVSLPAAGTYLLQADVFGFLSLTGAGTSDIKAKLVNTTAGADVPNTVRRIVVTGLAGVAFGLSSAITSIITVTVPTVITLWAMRLTGGQAFAASTIASDANGYTVLSYVKLL